MWQYSPVFVEPGRKPEDRFSHEAAKIEALWFIRFPEVVDLLFKDKLDH